MKKVLILLVFAIATLTSTSSMAQNYFTYDGDAFNVYLKTNTDNTQVLEVKFTDAAKTKWISFEIVDFADLEDTEDGGFLYTVKDGAGKKFTIDYYRTKDNIIVTNVATGDNWTLYRREE